MAPPRSKQRRQRPPHSLVLSLSIIITCCLLSESSAFCLPSGHDAPSPSLSSFTFALGRQQQSTSSLSYASAATAAESGPMSKVDSSKSGGCPFLVTSFDHRVYTVNALFSEAGTLHIDVPLHALDCVTAPLTTPSSSTNRLTTNHTLRRRMQPLQFICPNTSQIRFLQ